MQNRNPSSNHPGRMHAHPEGVEIKVFNNGLTLICKEDYSSPVVSAQAWCETGSIHEADWLGSGLSHVLEHMLFKGTSNRAAGRIDQEIQEAGGYMNAYTSFDRTVYWIDVPDTGARVAVDVLCDIMQNASLPPDELSKELDVIRREMDMGQDDPNRRSSRRLFETAYTVSPYRFPIIGIPDIFNQLQPEDIRNYYTHRYVPNNIFLVVVGAVSADRVADWTGSAFHSRLARPMSSLHLPVEPRQTGPRVLVEEDKIELGHIHIAWHVPDTRHPDCPALDVLTCALGQGQSSRLYRELREKRGLVHHADAWLYTPGNAGLFGMSAVFDAEKLEEVREALMTECSRCLETALNEAELEKVKRQFASGYYARLKNMQGQAGDLGSNWLLTRDLSFSERYLESIQQLTPEAILSAAGRYLAPDTFTCYALTPPTGSGRTKTAKSIRSSAGTNRIELENGLVVLHKEDHRLPFIEFRLLCRGGVTMETPDTNGHTLLMSKLLIKGTQSRDSETIAREIESVGGSIGSYGGNNSFGVNLECLGNDLDLAMDLLEDILLNPAFPSNEIERERQIQIAGIKAKKDQLLQRAFGNLKRSLYGLQAYGLENIGTEASLLQADREGLAKRCNDLLTPGNSVLAVYGHINPSNLMAKLGGLGKRWQKPGGRISYPAMESAFKGEREARFVESVDKKQAVVIVGFPGVTLFDKDHYALDLLQECCSDLGSRLFLRIREKLGLAYYVGAQNFMGVIPGVFSLYAGTAAEEADRVVDELLKEANLLATEGVTQVELQRAKAKMIGQRKISRQDLGQQAMSAGLDELYGLGHDHFEKEDALYEAVGLSDVEKVANQILNPEKSMVSICLPTKETA